MEIQLRSVDHAPKNLPIWRTILDDLGQPPPRRVAKALGLSVRSVQRYNAQNGAPRVVCLALFWLTRWGMSQASANAVRDAQLAVAMVRALTAERDQLRAQVVHLQAISNHGAANEPLLRGPHGR